MRRLKREGGQNHRSNKASDDLDASEVAVAEEFVTPTGETTFLLPVEHSRTRSSLNRSNPPMSTGWKDLTCTEDEVMSNCLNKPGIKAREHTGRLHESEHYEQGNMPISKASSMLSIGEVPNSMQVYRADYTCATPPYSEEMENVLERDSSEDVAHFMADVEKEPESASDIELNRISETNVSLAPCGSVEVEQPSAVARAVNHQPQDPFLSLECRSRHTAKPKRKPRTIQKLKRMSDQESELSSQRSGCLVTPPAPSRSIVTSKGAEHQNSQSSGSSLHSVIANDDPTSDQQSCSERSDELVDDLEDMLTYPSPISLYPTKKATLLGRAISTSTKSRNKSRRSAVSPNKRPSSYSLHGDCSDDELAMSHDTGSGLTPVSKGHGRIREDRIPV